MNMEQMIVTPEMAKSWLENSNNSNRNISHITVSRYASDMAAGRWMDTHQNAIAFFEGGELADGQHRLMAVLKSGVPVRMYVAFGLKRAGAAAIDQGRPRSTADALIISGMVPASAYVSYSVAIVKLIRAAEESGSRVMTVQEVSAAIAELRDGIDFSNAATSKAQGGIKNAIVRSAIAVAFYHVDQKTLGRFCRVLVSGMPEGENDGTIITIRNRFMLDVHSKGGSERVGSYRLMLRFIDAYKKGQALTKAHSTSLLAFKSGVFNDK